MTDFAPQLALWKSDVYLGTYIPVNGWVDYDFSISHGSNDYINAPNPAVTSIAIHFDTDTIPDIYIGNWLYIFNGPTLLFMGMVTSRTSEYAWGQDGFILTWTYELAGISQQLQLMSWYNPSTYTSTTNDCIDLIINNMGKSTWGQVNQTTTWDNIDPTILWALWDASSYITTAVQRVGSNVQVQTLSAGWRNVWNDLVTLTYGAWGYLIENIGDTLVCVLTPQATYNVGRNQIATTITGTDNLPQLRNSVTITKYDGTTSTFRDQTSVRTYGEQSGNLTTYIVSTPDAEITGTKLLNGLAYPQFGTQHVEINLYNPNVSQELFYNLWFGCTGGNTITVDAPAPMGGNQRYIPVGYQLQASKSSWILGFDLIPYSVAVNSINWKQVNPIYTWSSYGVAFPTQKWSDL